MNRQALNLENAVAMLDKLEKLEEFNKQIDALNNQAAALSGQAIKVGLESQLEQLQDRLKNVDIKLANKEKEIIAARKSRIYVKSVPDTATVEILNIDQGFRQGMKLEPAEYHIAVSLKDYKPQDR